MAVVENSGCAAERLKQLRRDDSTNGIIEHTVVHVADGNHIVADESKTRVEVVGLISMKNIVDLLDIMRNGSDIILGFHTKNKHTFMCTALKLFLNVFLSVVRRAFDPNRLQNTVQNTKINNGHPSRVFLANFSQHIGTPPKTHHMTHGFSEIKSVTTQFCSDCMSQLERYRLEFRPIAGISLFLPTEHAPGSVSFHLETDKGATRGEFHVGDLALLFPESPEFVLSEAMIWRRNVKTPRDFLARLKRIVPDHSHNIERFSLLWKLELIDRKRSVLEEVVGLKDPFDNAREMMRSAQREKEDAEEALEKTKVRLSDAKANQLNAALTAIGLSDRIQQLNTELEQIESAIYWAGSDRLSS